MKNFRKIKLGLLFWKVMGYRLLQFFLQVLIFGLLFNDWTKGIHLSILMTIIKFIIYYLYDFIFYKFYRVATDEGFVLWFTGLPCSGKSTLADAVAIELKKQGVNVERLDGDIVRKGKLSNDLGFTKFDRDKNINRITFVSKLLSRNGTAVLASFVSPYKKTRNEIRKSVTNFIEVYVKASPKECARRDVKGMWAKAKEGKIKGFTGYDDPYESPENPEIIIDTEKEKVQQSTDNILKYLKEKHLI